MITLIIDASPFNIKVSCIDFEFVATGLRYYYNLQIMCGISFLYSMLISYMFILVFIAFIFLNFESFRKLFLFMKHFSSIHRFNFDIFKKKLFRKLNLRKKFIIFTRKKNFRKCNFILNAKEN